MKTKKLIALLLFGVAFSGLKAQTMYVRPNTGAQSSYAIANIKNLTFSGGNLVVTNITGGNVTFPLSSNRYLNFTNLTLATAVVNLCKGTTPTPLTNPSGSALKWYTVTGTTTAPIYTLIATGAPSPLTTTVASPSKVYAVSEVLSNGVESAKFKITVNVLALPTTPTTLTGTAAQGVLVGTTTPATYSTTAVVGATSYVWTVPTGVTIDSGQGSTTVAVNFNGVSAGAGAIGSISVQAVNANGCNSLAKSLALTKALPVAPAAIVMSNGITTTAITSFAPYMGTNTVLTLTATASLTATSYVWELPTGVNVVSGDPLTDRIITVNFLGVTSSNTFNYSTTATVPVSTNVLRIGVKSRNGVGDSITNNSTLTNPPTGSTAKLLTLTAVKPAAPAAVKLTNDAISTTTAVTIISKYVGTTTPLTLTATASALASSYEWELPTGVILVSGNASTDRIITVNFAGIPSGVTSYYIGAKAKNGIGYSVTDNSALTTPATTSTAKLLKVTTSLPAAVATVTGQITGVCGGSSYSYTMTASALASSYVIAAPVGSTVTSASNIANTGNVLATSDLTFSVNYPAGFVVTIATTVPNKSLVVTSVNGVGSSITSKTLTLSTAMAAITTVSGGTTYSSCNQTFSASAVVGASTYTWTVPTGASISSGQNTNTVVVNYGALTGTQTIKVLATNGCGVSSALKSVTLTAGACPLPKQAATRNVPTQVSMYPNPAREDFNIELNSVSDGQIEMTITSLNGAIISSKNIQLSEGSNVINEDISSLASGIYFVKLTNSSNNETIIKKLIKK